MAAGKSTVAQLLAERFDRSVHLRGDLFRTMVVNGAVEPAPDDEVADEHLRLRYRVAAAAADVYADAGFTVVLQDVIVGPLLAECISLVRTRPLHVVVLAPSVDGVEERERNRRKTGYGTWTPAALDAVLREDTPRVGLWVDSTAQTPGETAEFVLERLDEAIVAG
jgi:chloramphenicol 3-O-phosphotransferase